jgi:hypothetical protein
MAHSRAGPEIGESSVFRWTRLAAGGPMNRWESDEGRFPAGPIES